MKTLSTDDLLSLLEPFKQMDAEETAEWGAPLRDLIFVFPAYRDDRGQLKPKIHLLSHYIRCEQFNLTCELSEFVDEVHYFPKAKPFLSIFE